MYRRFLLKHYGDTQVLTVWSQLTAYLWVQCVSCSFQWLCSFQSVSLLSAVRCNLLITNASQSIIARGSNVFHAWFTVANRFTSIHNNFVTSKFDFTFELEAKAEGSRFYILCFILSLTACQKKSLLWILFCCWTLILL